MKRHQKLPFKGVKPVANCRKSGNARPQYGRKRGAQAPEKGPQKPNLGTIFYGEVYSVGAWRRVRVFHRDLVALDVITDADTDLNDGDIVKVKLLPQGRFGAKAIVQQNLGPCPAGLASLVAMVNHKLPFDFPPEVLKQAAGLGAFEWPVQSSHKADTNKNRTDWTQLNIVTIDGADARDFDDAVWAETTDNGYHIIVAIADVAHYVLPGSPLDLEARDRGNSTYLPDRVIPMLPEKLSNDLCSLRPHEIRPVVGVDMWLNQAGELVKHRFARGVIRSAARLTYEQVQAALDGICDDVTQRLLPELFNLQAAYRALQQARLQRGAIDLDLPEAKVVLNQQGEVTGVAARPRLEAHRLIEELMILANVAAAETLSGKHGGKGSTGLYRIHDKPERTKLATLKQALSPLGFTVPAPEAPPKHWARLAEQVQQHPAAQSLLRLVLQSQQQARYAPGNIGHFGLALPLYAHFTSPIRRYSDLVVHRALIAALTLAGDGGEKVPEAKLANWGEHLADTERASQKAEWEARDRLIADYYAKLLLENKQATTPLAFDAVVVSVQPFGCFVAIDGVAEGLLPARLMGDFWRYLPEQLAWKNNRQRMVLRPGSTLKVRLIDADRAAGRLTFAMLNAE